MSSHGELQATPFRPDDNSLYMGIIETTEDNKQRLTYEINITKR